MINLPFKRFYAINLKLKQWGTKIMDTTATTTNTIESPKTNYYAPITKEMILDYLRELKPQLEKDGITKLGLFGSYANGYAKKISSDIDIVIEVNRELFHKRGLNLGYFSYLNRIRENIEERFHRDVDLCDLGGFKDYEIPNFFRGVIYV